MRVKVLKRNLAGQVTWSYDGELLAQTAEFVRVEALFNRDDLPFEGIVLKRNDRFVETFYFDRPYNVFAMYDRDDGMLKGWYCNVALPAVREADAVISYVDLALDLWVTPAGRWKVLDEDEFEALAPTEQTRQQAQAALNELIALAEAGQLPG